MMKRKTLKKMLRVPLQVFFSNILTFGGLRKFVLGYIDKSLYQNYLKFNRRNRPIKVQEDKAAMVSSILHAVDRGLREGTISQNVWQKFFRSLSSVYANDKDRIQDFAKKYGSEPPGFITISPGAFCNLECSGCYANSSTEKKKKLDYSLVTRIVSEQKKLWGSHFTVISGGEPLLWNDQGKTVFDLAKEHSDTFFLMYTNGTAITRKVAQKFAEVGNITPAISVEGFEAETDKRRGKGVHKKIIDAFDNLKKVGVPFGVSATVTRENVEIIKSKEFFDYYLYKQGALYCWMFQYMPIGRGVNFDNVVTPEQRISLYKKTWEYIRNEKMFIADFWNCGTVSNGCISGGVHGGYIYIDWNGNVMPCVFNPYYTHNIKEIYANGGTIDDALFSPFFEGIRKWQNSYAFTSSPKEMGNVIAPCAIRDHFDMMHSLISETGAKGGDEQAQLAITDEDFKNNLLEYGKHINDLSSSIWQNEYLEPEKEKIN